MVVQNEQTVLAFMTPRQRVLRALDHREPDRVPVDFLAAPEIWDRLSVYFHADTREIDTGGYFSAEREWLLRRLEIDCRLISYDMFCAPPARIIKPSADVDWWLSLARSTPNRMWRQVLPDQTSYDIWGHHIRTIDNPTGVYEEFASYPLQEATTTAELSHFDWPEPDWWEVATLKDALEKVNPGQAHHLRFRAGSVFESSWQLRGMPEFMMDLGLNPDIPLYIMDRLCEVIVENTRRTLAAAGDQIDMVYFYDDVGAQNGLMISKNMWKKFIRPYHLKIIETARQFNKPVMYHCDGAIYPLVEELIELGIDVLDPIQPSAKDMHPDKLKQEFGDRLCFHGGIDIQETLPRGSPDDVAAEVAERVGRLGKGGGYILSSSHHIQSDTPIENVMAMYQTSLRYRK
jgi:uroporphyrinogen decarboxylase